MRAGATALLATTLLMRLVCRLVYLVNDDYGRIDKMNVCMKTDESKNASSNRSDLIDFGSGGLDFSRRIESWEKSWYEQNVAAAAA